MPNYQHIDLGAASGKTEGETSLKLLQAIYKDKKQPLNVRVRCAIEALPFEVPKLSATAIATMDGKTFAEAARSEQSSAANPRHY